MKIKHLKTNFPPKIVHYFLIEPTDTIWVVNNDEIQQVSQFFPATNICVFFFSNNMFVLSQIILILSSMNCVVERAQKCFDIIKLTLWLSTMHNNVEAVNRRLINLTYSASTLHENEHQTFYFLTDHLLQKETFLEKQ